MTNIDVDSLRDKVRAMYQAVADEPHGKFHFELGYDLAARLGYATSELDQIPPEAVESFADDRMLQLEPTDGQQTA